MSWYTSEQAFACKSATGSTDPLPRMRNASRIGCSERSLAAVAKLYGALRAALYIGRFEVFYHALASLACEQSPKACLKRSASVDRP